MPGLPSFPTHVTLQDVTYGVGLAELQGELLAFADVDANEFIDFFAVGERGGELQAWLWQGPVGQGGEGAGFAAPAQERRAEVAGLVGLIPGDFDGDGVLDAVAMTRAVAMTLHSAGAHSTGTGRGTGTGTGGGGRGSGGGGGGQCQGGGGGRGGVSRGGG